MPRRHKYTPYVTKSGKKKTWYGHAHPGYPTIYFNPEKSNKAQASTIIHEALHAWEPHWWRGYGGVDGPPELMVRRLEGCIYDLVAAFLEAQERSQKTSSS